MISILRLGHRIVRDQRISSHCALVARALGAKAFLYSGQRDSNLEASILRVSGQWGGSLKVSHVQDWKKAIKSFKGLKIHLSVYGLPFQKALPKIRKSKSRNILLIVGGEKVPPDAYQLSDLNLSVGQQPHSEIGALAIFLYELSGRKSKQDFQRAKLRVVPQERGKKVLKR
jgi:tRNA (cytidine56-2'-O)-methyltransferase